MCRSLVANAKASAAVIRVVCAASKNTAKFRRSI
jgi:hypothetical protein